MIDATRRLDGRGTVLAMHGYVAFAPVVSEIRPAQHAIDPEPLERPGELECTAVLDNDVTSTRPLNVRLRDAVADLREVWAQTTFFVLDPNSWG